MATNSPIDAYLEGRPPDQREALQRLRSQIKRLLPDAVEVISYGMPAFRVDGNVVVWIAAWKAHCSIYPLTDTFRKTHADALQGYTITRGSVHFTPATPLPETVVEALVRARLAELEGDPG